LERDGAWRESYEGLSSLLRAGMKTRLRIVIPGGSGRLGNILARYFHTLGHDVVVLARRATPVPWRIVNWDGASLGTWQSELENVDVLINLAGKSVNCRYTPANRAIKESRIQTTQLLGQAISQSVHPPRVWMNASTATIYRHALDRPMDENSGDIGGNEPNAPAKWRFSIDVATSWEKAFFEAPASRHPAPAKLRFEVP
jgi:uncharacterized protein